MKKLFRDHIPTLVSILSAAALLVISLLWFRSSMEKQISATSESYLIENTRAFAAVFATKLNDQIAVLESQTRFFEDVDLQDREAMKNAIMSSDGGTGAFTNVCVSDMSGFAIDRNGNIPENALPADFLRAATNGSVVISQSMTENTDGEKIITAGVPIKRRGVTVGVIYGTFAGNILDTLINIPDHANREASLLLDSKGNVLAASEGFDLSRMSISNFFDDTDAVCPGKNNNSVTECMIGGVMSTVVTTTVGVHDWYFVSVIPKSAVDAQISGMSRDMTVMILIIAFAFLILFISIMYLMKSNSVMLRTNEKFKLVTVESQDLIFDYNFQKQVLTLDGSTDNITSSSKNEFSKSDTLGFIALIHDEDKDMRMRILDVANTDETAVKGEFRLKCLDGTYSWFRIRATVVRSHDGHAQRMIGSLINVDEQMNREMRLIEKAESDPLTGVYNKSAFYDHVSANLRTASDSDLYAIYIIDIDNFKSVNDDLGHSMGDQVLSDVAKKLCIIFSDIDYVGRVGGDEFAAFLHLPSKARNVGMSIIDSKAKAICSHLSETYQAKKKEVSITASVGVSIYPYSGRDYNTLFRNADKALEKVKKNGKDQYGVYSPDEKY